MPQLRQSNRGAGAVHRVFVLMVLWSALTPGCAPSATPAPAPLPFATITPDLPYQGTSTPTVLPTATIPVSVAMSLPTAPTSSLDQNSPLVETMIATNGDCALPCWWGGKIVPGHTKAEDAQSQFSGWGIPVLDETGLLASTIFVPSPNEPEFDNLVNIHVRKKDGLVQSIVMHGITQDRWNNATSDRFIRTWKPYYAWDAIMDQFGAPDEIRLGVRHSFGKRPAYYWMVMIYEEAGIGLAYSGPSEDLISGTARACPAFDFVTTITLVLTVPGAGLDISDFSLVQGDTIDYDLGNSQSDHTLGLTPQTFHAQFRNTGRVPCFEEKYIPPAY